MDRSSPTRFFDQLGYVFICPNRYRPYYHRSILPGTLLVLVNALDRRNLLMLIEKVKDMSNVFAITSTVFLIVLAIR